MRSPIEFDNESEHQISKVRVPARKLFHRDAVFGAFDSSAQPIGKRSKIQFFS